MLLKLEISFIRNIVNIYVDDDDGFSNKMFDLVDQYIKITLQHSY